MLFYRVVTFIALIFSLWGSIALADNGAVGEYLRNRSALPAPVVPTPVLPSSEKNQWRIITRKVSTIRAMKKGVFEPTANFQKRVQNKTTALEKKINTAAKQGDKNYQAGIGTMTAYDADHQIMTLKLVWKKEVKTLISGLKQKTGIINIPYQTAEAIFSQQKTHPLFISIHGVNQNLQWNIALSAGGKHYSVSNRDNSKITAANNTIVGSTNDKSIKRYIVNDNGTAVDTVTGLMWMRCLIGQQWTGQGCSGKAGAFKWQDATRQTANFAGLDDWRIPTITELRSLVYCSSGKPDYFNPDVNKAHFMCDGNYKKPTLVHAVFPDAPTSIVWSGSPYAALSGDAWGVSFGLGADGYGDRGYSRHVRLVRDGQ
ncbi:DUF1566 domain-containing protein [Candidatus Venteria ishoeyi]|uniref:Lcl C-terminal domain-containing protein n=1 Tax=Candidatus Venteria ishoeyi TaxID=1899563 RepID=UPI0025A63893|nr:DUF1566 domain-containing protein [Candidatus Venteria ishoeyi]MDM8545816.1 DUF1566 domain-containing protein [Candidatus Venteria ishoeyi]